MCACRPSYWDELRGRAEWSGAGRGVAEWVGGERGGGGGWPNRQTEERVGPLSRVFVAGGGVGYMIAGFCFGRVGRGGRK